MHYHSFHYWLKRVCYLGPCIYRCLRDHIWTPNRFLSAALTLCDRQRSPCVSHPQPDIVIDETWLGFGCYMKSRYCRDSNRGNSLTIDFRIMVGSQISLPLIWLPVSNRHQQGIDHKSDSKIWGMKLVLKHILNALRNPSAGYGVAGVIVTNNITFYEIYRTMTSSQQCFRNFAHQWMIYFPIFRIFHLLNDT